MGKAERGTVPGGLYRKCAGIGTGAAGGPGPPARSPSGWGHRFRPRSWNSSCLSCSVPPTAAGWNIHVHYSKYTGEWNIEGKSYDKGNIKAQNTYGTERISGYKIVEETLNLRDVRIFDYETDHHGNRVPILNKKETAIAQGKQQLIKQAFQDWIWKDPPEGTAGRVLYNDNSTAPVPVSTMGAT